MTNNFSLTLTEKIYIYLSNMYMKVALLLPQKS